MIWPRVLTDEQSQNALLSKSYKSGMFVGFLPMFGPCYVNFYGSPREYSELMTEFEELNFGKVSIES